MLRIVSDMLKKRYGCYFKDYGEIVKPFTIIHLYENYAGI